MCAGGRRPAREPSAPRASLGASSRSPARPRHRPPAPRQVPPAPSTPVAPGCCVWLDTSPRSRPGTAGLVAASLRSAPRLEARPCPPDPPAPSTPVGPGVLMVGLARCLEARLQLLIINFARNSFTAHSNIECVSLELQRFWGVSKSDRDKLRAKCGWRWCRRRPWAPQPGSVDQVSRWFETAIAFARLCLCGCETAIAFAGEKWVFLACFSIAEVPPVSTVAVWG